MGKYLGLGQMGHKPCTCLLTQTWNQYSVTCTCAVQDICCLVFKQIFHSKLLKNTYSGIPDLSNLLRKRKLVRKIGSSKNQRWHEVTLYGTLYSSLAFIWVVTRLKSYNHLVNMINSSKHPKGKLGLKSDHSNEKHWAVLSLALFSV